MGENSTNFLFCGILWDSVGFCGILGRHTFFALRDIKMRVTIEDMESETKRPKRKGIFSLVFGGLWRVIKSHSSMAGIVLGVLFLCFLMMMVAYGLILSKIQRTYAVLVMFITTFVLTIPSHYLLIRMVYRLTGKHFLEKYAHEREIDMLRAELAERKQKEETRSNNSFPQERGQKVSWVPVWEQRIDQPVFDSIPFETEKRVQIDRHSLLYRGARKMYHWIVPVKINREEKPDKEDRLFVAGHIKGRRGFWVDADDITVCIDEPDKFIVHGLDEHAIHAGFLDDAESPSFKVEKYFSWAVSAKGGNYRNPDNIRKFELVRDDELSLRSSAISLHWDRLVDDVKNDTSRVMSDVLSATREKIISTLKAADATKTIEFANQESALEGSESKRKQLSDFSMNKERMQDFKD